MVSDVYSQPSEIASIAGALVVVGALAVAQVRRVRRDRKDRTTVHDAVIGTPPTVVDGMIVREGEPGLLRRMSNVETRLARLDNKLTPNGLNTNNPGDVMARTEQKVDQFGSALKKVIDHLGIEDDE